MGHEVILGPLGRVLPNVDPSRLVIASNRGPVSWVRAADGTLEARRGGGGLVASLGPLVRDTGATWIAAPMSDADRQAAGGGKPVDAEGYRFRALDLDPATYRMAYEVVANSTLWFLHHHLWDLPRRPRFDRRWREAWDGYRLYNEAFARALADESPEDGVVLVQDYHLSLVAPVLATKRPDLRLVHFHHTPFCAPSWLEVLPSDIAHELMTGLGAYHACGFHSPRWEADFRACCASREVPPPPTFVSPLPAAHRNLDEVAGSDACATEGRDLDQRVAGRKLIVRVDRMEPSKNILRGFLAYDDLLDQRPEVRGRVVFAAFCYPSREGLADYVGYHSEVESVVAAINARWATAEWTPILLHTEDNFARSVAALQRYDVLLVNPVRDGMNLVALEGPAVNRNRGVVVLSRQAGAWDQLGSSAAIGVDPFDVSGTSDAIGAALETDDETRIHLSERAAALSRSRPLSAWLTEQLAAVDGSSS